MKKILLVLLPLLLMFSACTTFTPDEQERIDFIKDMINNPRKIEEIIKSSKYYDSTYEEKLKNGHLPLFEKNLIESLVRKVNVELEIGNLYSNYDRIKDYPGLKKNDSCNYLGQSISIIFDKKIIRPHIFVLSFKNFKDGKWKLTNIGIDFTEY